MVKQKISDGTLVNCRLALESILAGNLMIRESYDKIKEMCTIVILQHTNNFIHSEWGTYHNIQREHLRKLCCRHVGRDRKRGHQPGRQPEQRRGRTEQCRS